MWDVIFSKLIARGLVDILPVALVSFYAIYKSNHPIELKEPYGPGHNTQLAGNENKEKDSSEQMEVRTVEKRKRITQLLTQLVLLAAVLAAICTVIKGLASYHEYWDWPVLFLLFFFLLCIPILLREPYTEELIGNISTKKASYLLRTILPFSFYLRQFSTDKYHTYREDPDSFSEGVLANGLKHRLIRLFDLGHPAEIDSPIGGVRVYATSD